MCAGDCGGCPQRTAQPSQEMLRVFEQPSDGRLYDETDVSLRAYVTRIPDEKLCDYEPSWSDKRVVEWDGNFRDDRSLMLVCCERDVGVDEYREVLEEFLAFRSHLAGT